MKKLRYLKEIWIGGCIRFTVFAICLMIFRAIASGGLADGVISIPMEGMINSLNASVAAGVAVFEALRQRSK